MNRNKSLLGRLIKFAILPISILIFPLMLNADDSATIASMEPPGITKVVLYKHGMGYIERQGKVCGVSGVPPEIGTRKGESG